MNAREFVAHLRALSPEKDLLLECDYEDDEAVEFIDSFACRSRFESLVLDTHDDPMLELLRDWEMAHIEIGPIAFHEVPRKYEHYVEVGTVEGDRLVYRLETRDYGLLDFRNLSVMCLAAKNGNALLDGMVEAAGYFAKTAVDEIDLDDEAAGAEFKDKCAKAFGGVESETFCTSIFGF